MYVWKTLEGKLQLVLSAQVVGILPPRYPGGWWRLEPITGYLPAPLALLVYRWARHHNARHRRWYDVRLSVGYRLPDSLPWPWQRRLRAVGGAWAQTSGTVRAWVHRIRKRLKVRACELRYRLRRRWRAWVRLMGVAMVSSHSSPRPARHRSWRAWKRW